MATECAIVKVEQSKVPRPHMLLHICHAHICHAHPHLKVPMHLMTKGICHWKGPRRFSETENKEFDDSVDHRFELWPDVRLL